MTERSITKKTTDGLIWSGLQKLVSRGLQFIFSILIARILLPEDYGIVAIANLFIALSDILVDSGFSKALIRKNDKTELDYNTVFWFNLTVSCLLYALLFFLAPIIGRWYHASSILVPVIRIISLSLIINAICGIQSLHLVIEMNFKKLAIFETLAMLIGGAAGLFAAIKGFGVWALVIQALASCFFRTVFLWLSSHWKPAFMFSSKIMGQFFAFGSQLLVSEYINRIYTSVMTLVIGKKFNPENLGYYGKAEAFASTPSSIFAGPLGSVSYPALAEIQNENERMLKNFYSMIGLTAFIVFPVFVGLICTAQNLVPVFLTEKWNPMIPYLQILSLAYLINSLAIIPQNYLLVLGQSKRLLHIQLSSKVLGLCLLPLLLNISLLAICAGIVVVAATALFLTFFFLKKEFHFSIGLLLKAIFPSAATVLVMSAAILLTNRLIDNTLIALISGVAVGFLVYMGISVIVKNQQLVQLKSLLSPYLKAFSRK